MCLHVCECLSAAALSTQSVFAAYSLVRSCSATMAIILFIDLFEEMYVCSKYELVLLMDIFELFGCLPVKLFLVIGCLVLGKMQKCHSAD